MTDNNIAMIQEVARGLGDLKNEVVFVGGAAVSLYLDLDVAGEIRPTEDVDVVVEITSLARYQKLNEKLLSMKFIPDASPGAPICRWKYLGITIDIMPLDENILGFSNKHYVDGFNHKKGVSLPDGQEIFIFSLGYFLACKLEAFFGRGIKDPRFSKDLEDIIAILSDAQNFNLIEQERSIIPFLQKSLEKIFSDSSIVEAIQGFLVGSVSGQYDLVLEKVRFISSL